MKNYNQLLALFIAFFLFAGFACQSVNNEKSDPNETKDTIAFEELNVIEDITLDAPDNTNLLLQNEFVRVIKFMLLPNDSLPLFKCHESITLAQSDCKLKYTILGKETVKECKNSEIFWLKEANQAIVNIGESEVEFILIERLNTVLPKSENISEAIGIDKIADVAIEQNFENETFKVIKATIPPNTLIEKHNGQNHLIYSFGSFELEFDIGEKRLKKSSFNIGNVKWFNAREQSIENISDNSAEFLVFEIKK